MKQKFEGKGQDLIKALTGSQTPQQGQPKQMPASQANSHDQFQVK